MTRSSVLTFVLALLLPILVIGCDGLTNVTEMNENPTEATDMDPELQFVDLPLAVTDNRYEAWRANLIHADCISQHVAGTTTAWSGCRYLRNEEYLNAYWDMKWEPMRNIEDVLSKTDPDEHPEYVNINAMTRVLRVFLMHRMTDLYGDIPYEDGGKGMTGDIQNPEYDAQEDIYSAMVSDLQEARDLLDPSVSTLDAGHDLLFAADVEKWRRFANSLMLRIGMRMSEVDPSQAQSVVEDAISGGVMESNDDVAYTEHVESDGKKNGIGEVFNDFGVAGHGFRMSKTFMDVLKGEAGVSDALDPRTNIFAAQYDGDGNLVSDDPDDLEGLENGLGSSENPLPDNLSDFAQPHREYMVQYSSPDLWMSYAEVKFLEAEAALRGWHPSDSDARAHYEEGIDAAMKHLTIYGAPEIPQGDIDDYIDSLPDREPTLEEVIEQKWIALFLNGYESWAELRRTGYPEVIEPVDYPGNVTGGQIPGRLEYPASEEQVNEENFQKVLDRQGDDEMSTRLWWDTEGPATID